MEAPGRGSVSAYNAISGSVDMGKLGVWLALLGLTVPGLTPAFGQGIPSSAQQPPAPVSQAPAESMIDQIKRCVVYVVGNYVVDGQPRQAAGTGFLIFVPDARLGSDKAFLWLVTSKHVLREPRADGTSGPYFRSILIRYNTKRPISPDGAQFALSPLQVLDDRGNLTWFVSLDDETVDLALTPVHVDEEAVDFMAVPVALFATKELIAQRQVSENDEVLFTGLFAWYPGAKKNYPIVRHGKVALIPNERIPLDRKRPDITADIYLAEITSFGGNSGSPVFVRQGGVRETPSGSRVEGYSYYLLGVMQGFFPEASPVAVETTVLHGEGEQNSGIAAVVPADEILRILGSARARAWVDRAVQGELSGKRPAPR